jgi:hypothetical protein
MYQRQLTINKELEAQVLDLRAAHKLSLHYCRLAERKIISLEEALLDDECDCWTEYEEVIKTMEKQIADLEAGNRDMTEALETADSVIVVNTKKIDEFEGKNTAGIH